MLRVLTSRRRAPRVLRTREPRGIIDGAEATARLRDLVGAALVDVETSLDRLVLAIAGEPLHFVVLAGPVVVVTRRSVRLSAEPADPDALGALQALRGRPVTGVRVSKSGTLRIDLGADRLVMEPDAAHEAWEVRRADGDLLVCLPGGKLSLWAPTFGDVPAAG